MLTRSLGILGLAAALLGGGCRQADGPLPTPTGEVPGRLIDLSRNLENIARGDAQAQTDLADDLYVFVDRGDARPAIDELSRRTAGAISGKALPEQTAHELANKYWVSVAARDLSERQVDTLQNDVRSLLVSAGVAEDTAQSVAEQVDIIQSAVTERPRRWYEWF
jgi:hypothetical protein